MAGSRFACLLLAILATGGVALANGAETHRPPNARRATTPTGLQDAHCCTIRAGSQIVTTCQSRDSVRNARSADIGEAAARAGLTLEYLDRADDCSPGAWHRIQRRRSRVHAGCYRARRDQRSHPALDEPATTTVRFSRDYGAALERLPAGPTSAEYRAALAQIAGARPAHASAWTGRRRLRERAALQSIAGRGSMRSRRDFGDDWTTGGLRWPPAPARRDCCCT